LDWAAAGVATDSTPTAIRAAAVRLISAEGDKLVLLL
jgi:hypothetical protein